MQSGQEIDEALKEIMAKEEIIIRSKDYALKALTGKLETLSPEAVLKRGYSITFLEGSGRVIKDASDVKKSDILKTKVFKGEIASRVESMKRG